MAHFSENSKPLVVKRVLVEDHNTLLNEARDLTDVCMLILPLCPPDRIGKQFQKIEQVVADVGACLGHESTLVTLGEPVDLIHVHAALVSSMTCQHWIAIKRASLQTVEGLHSLPQHHFGALIHTCYKSSLRHTKTRAGYTYCPNCDKTTKDYGGKKHTYHEYGTLISDVWRDIACDLDGDLSPVIERFADFFGIDPYRELRVLDCRGLPIERVSIDPPVYTMSQSERGTQPSKTRANKLVVGDCLEQIQKIPDNSVDFAFADPPYNLGKKYTGYTDDLSIMEYFQWCDRWVAELARVLRPGRTCAILNIPLWAIRHFLYMEKVLRFQNWIVWDALSFPVRLIMPAHYAILCFSKGPSRRLPGLTGESGQPKVPTSTETFSLQPLAEGFCLRSKCVLRRQARSINDRGPLTDLWWDVHRLKHNSRRVDHPCQLPPRLMYRLLSIFTSPGETVLDCFNGAGTTTLAAHQLGRNFIGIEKVEDYHMLALERHEEIDLGLDPFRKADRPLTAKNSPVPRMPKRNYEVPKKTLQMEVKRVASELGRLPTRHELAGYGKYPIRYYDEYFASWGEVCAAARTTGMSETRKGDSKNKVKQLRLFELGE